MGKFTNRIPEAEKPGPLSITTSDGLELVQSDGDTWYDSSGQGYRLGGVNLEETAKVIKDGKKTTFKEGHIGGRAATLAMYELQKRGNFNRLVDTGETDKHGRKIIRFHDELGNDLTDAAHASKIAQVSKYTDENSLTASDEADLEAELLGKEHEYADIAADLKKAREPFGVPIFKTKALNEANYAANPDAYDGVQFRTGGRTIDNKSLNPWSDSWDSGWLGVKEGLYGFADLIGQGTGIEWLESIGENGVARAQRQAKNTPELTLDYKQVDNVWKGFEYVTNNAIMSAPYLAIGLGGAILSPFTFGATGAIGTGTLGGTYIGQFWNEMEGERGATQMTAAILGGTGAAVLDRLGIAGLIKPSALLTSTGRNRAITALTNKRMQAGATGELPKISHSQAKREAKSAFDNMTRQEIVSSINYLGKITSDNIARFSGKNIIKRGGTGFASESLTEVSQEGLQAATVANFSDTEFTREEIINRLLNAGLAGGTIGGGIAGAAAIKTEAGQELLRRDLERKEIDLTALDSVRQADQAAGINIKTVDDINNETRSRRQAKGGTVDPNKKAATLERSERHQKEVRGIKNLLNSTTSLTDVISTLWEGANRLHRASVETAIPTALALTSPALRKLKAKIGNGIVGGTYYSGRNEVAYRNQLEADIESHSNSYDIVVNKLKNKNNFQKSQEKVSDELVEFITSGAMSEVISAKTAGIEPDITKIDSKFHGKIEEYYQSIKSLENGYKAMLEMMNDAHKKQTGQDLPADVQQKYLEWFKLKTPDRAKVKQNQRAFKEFLRKQGLTTGEADAIYNRIVQGEDLDTDQSIFRDTIQPWHSKVQEALANDKDNKFSTNNVFDTFDSQKTRTAKYASNSEYYGEGGTDIDQLLEEAAEEGVDDKTLDHVAWHVKNIIDSSNGTYNRIKSPYIAGAVKMATTLSSFIGLGLSALSSIPETALIFERIDNSKEARQAIGALSKEFAHMFKAAFQNHFKYYYDGKLYDQSKGQTLLDRAGHPLSATTAQQRLGVGSTAPSMQRWLNFYFKATGIQGITAFQRRASASFAVDYIYNRLDSLSYVPTRKDGTVDLKQANRRQQQHYNDLANLGINVDKLIEMYNTTGRQIDISRDTQTYRDLANSLESDGLDSKLIDEMDAEMQTAIYAFVNQKVQNPQYANRPLVFQDPTLQLFTQFNGFISTFTAQALPRILRYGILNGTPNVKANTAALIVLMIGLGGASQYLKDLLKFGKDSPYVDDWRNIQRAIYSSGVLGQGERVVDQFLPLYPQRGDGLDKIWNAIIGEAGPSLRVGTNIAEGLGNLAEGDTHRAIDKGLKATPLAPFTGTRKAAAELINSLLQGRSP